MENASKALIIAAGVLIALLIIGALLLMFNQMGAYQKSNSSATKDSQIAAFNQEFSKYAEESEIRGTDIISLVNKVIDFNQKEGITNSVDYDKKITVKVLLGTSFANKYGTNGKLKIFNTSQYSITDSNNSFVQAINTFLSLESRYTLSVMSSLSANYDSIKDGSKTVQQITGKNISISTNEIEQYREYSEFKISTFTSNSDPIYKDGQITELSFKFVK